MIAHLRPIFLTFLGLAFGICITLLAFTSSIWYLIAVAIVIVLGIILLLLRLAFKNSKFFQNLGKITWYFIILAAATILGSGLYLISTAVYTVDFHPNENKYYGISGIIESNYLETEKGFYFFVTDASVLDESNITNLQRNIYVYIRKNKNTTIAPEQLEKILPGNQVFITTQLTETPVFADDGINSFAYKNNFQHTAYTSFENIAVIDGKMNFMDGVREYIRNLYKQYMDERYAGLAFSVLVGDRAELAFDIQDNFQITGIAHVVAVSGLNTAFIMMLLLWLLRVFKANRWVKLTTVIVVLVLYAWLCDFTPSIIRASLMSIFLLIGNLFGKQSDKLNNVSLAAVLILLFNPLYIFDLSFLLSFFGVFGIFFLYPVLQRAFAFLKWKPLINSTALTVAATIGTAPLIINTFNYFSIIGLVANLVLVPLFGYAFMLLFLLTILALIIPYIGYAFTVVQYGFWVVDKGAWLFALVPFASVYVPTVPTYATVSYYLGMFAASRYNLVDEGTKIVSTTVLFAVFVFGLMFAIISAAGI